MTTDTAGQVNVDASEPVDRWELIVQWRRAIKTFRIVASVAMILFALVILSEALRFYDLFARLHVVAGLLYLALLFAGIFVLVGIPAWRYWRVPKVLRPPDVHFDELGVRHADLVKRVRFLDRYCRALQRNPELLGKTKEIERVVGDVRALRQRVKRAPAGTTAVLIGEIQKFETKTIDPLLADLDARVDSYVRKEALAVGFSTAVCTNGTLDAFFVLWRAVNMVSRISRLYYGRPGLQGTLVLLGDVASAVVLSRTMDNLSDMVGDLAAESPGLVRAIPGVNVFAGPVLDGTINAVMMMRVGYLAKRRCRSFEAWDKKSMRTAVADVVQTVAQQTAGIAGDLVNAVSGYVMPMMNRAFKTAASAAGAGMGAARDIVGASADAVVGGGANVWQVLQSFWSGGPDRTEKGTK